MKIVSQTSNEIKIAYSSQDKAERNDFLLGLSFLLILAAPLIFVFSMIAFIPIIDLFKGFNLIGVTRISCDRIEPKQVDCQLSKSNFFDLIQEESTTIKFVESAGYSREYIPIVTELFGNNYGKGNFQITSKIDKPKSFEIYLDSGNKTARSVNSFLASQEKTLVHIADDRNDKALFNVLAIKSMIILLILLGWFFLLYKIFLNDFFPLLSEDSIILNKSQRSFKYIKNIPVVGTKVDALNFTDVAKVDVLYSSDSYDNVSYKPRIAMTSNVKYYLDTISDRQVAIKVANDLNRFMGFPEEEDPVVKA